MAYADESYFFALEQQQHQQLHEQQQQRHHQHHHHHHQHQTHHPHQQNAGLYFPSLSGYPTPSPQAHRDAMYQPFSYGDYGEFLPTGGMYEEYEDLNEISTRPRLTKEQADILETQFQEHPKPNGVLKKQLAAQTKLTLPRVANWFQNRRAKAKQMKKQEEFEIQQNLAAKAKDEPVSNSAQRPSPITSEPSCAAETQRLSTGQSLPEPTTSDTIQESRWASSQQALGQQTNISLVSRMQRERPMPSMLPPERLHVTMQHVWPSASPSLSHEMGFDFGFDQDLSSGHNSTSEGSSEDLTPLTVIPAEEWSTYVGETQSQDSFTPTAVSPALALSAHPPSRRGSAADELAANFGTVALAGTPPLPQLKATEGEIDIASRRKRPRPAALTTASLRSRSYGALSSTSPSFRNTPPSAGLRHAKSMGHSLNNHYAGIRKASIPSKSPLNISTFAEADSIRQLMSQQASQVTPVATENSVLPERPAPYRHVQSPPVTPFQSDCMMPNVHMHPPLSAASQFASFAEYTPPYSAGPLTTSTCSFSDAPLHSPDLPVFPSRNFMSSLGFAAHEPPFHPWVLPSDSMPEPSLADDKKTEFFITEFPGQKEEHASIASKITPQRPRNYTFANTAPSDYDA